MSVTYRQHQDTRDGKIYNCVLMPDGKWWSAENLAYLGAGDDGYYSDAESETAVPPGAHIPGGPGTTSNEWNSLAIACTGDANTAAVKLKSTTGWVLNGTDDYGFNAQPSGYWRRDYTHTPWYFVPNEGNGIWGWNYTGNPSSSYQVHLPKNTQAVSTSGGFSTDLLRQRYRFIVDVFNEPNPLQLFGAPFQGFERGLSCTIKRQILVDDSMGGSVTLTPVAPAAFDEWAIDAELWVSAAQAQALEAIVPPRGVPLENAIRLPPRGGEASFPGLLPFAQATGYDQYATPMVTAFESLGRKAPGVDLFGYRIALSFFAEADGLALNGSPTPTTTPPTWLVGKFTAHQIQDWSSQGEVVAATTLAGHPSPRGSFYPIKHGRRRDVNFNLDHLSTDRANELVALFRGVRHNPVTVNMDRGSEGIAPTSVYLVDLSLQRGAGLWWDGTLKAVLA